MSQRSARALPLGLTSSALRAPIQLHRSPCHGRVADTSAETGRREPIMNGNEPNEMLSAQKALARETVKAVADVFALKVILASTGRTEDELETELGRLREGALYKSVVEAGEFRIGRAEQNQQLLDVLVRIRNAA